MKALTASPFPDFNLCISLLDDRSALNTALLDRDEPDTLPTYLPVLTTMHALLHQCRFIAFWELYRSESLDDLRDNYTVEFVGFEDSVREVVIRAVTATFTRISSERLGAYLELSGQSVVLWIVHRPPSLTQSIGPQLEGYISNLGWSFEGSVICIPPNPDNQIESTVVQEAIKMTRACLMLSFQFVMN
jgi:translation initiation factor 3 subunit K